MADPKGNLYKKYSSYMRNCGYKVFHIDLIHPETSDRFNPRLYVHNSDDACKLATQIVNLGYGRNSRSSDPFWDRAAELLMQALIGLVMEKCPDVSPSINGISELLTKVKFVDDETFSLEDSELYRIFVRHAGIFSLNSRNKDERSWAYNQMLKFMTTPPRTFGTIQITLHTMLGAFFSKGLKAMTSSKNSIDLQSIGREKTIVFLEISDTDRSKDLIANIFYSQAMNELCTYADDH